MRATSFVWLRVCHTEHIRVTVHRYPRNVVYCAP